MSVSPCGGKVYIKKDPSNEYLMFVSWEQFVAVMNILSAAKCCWLSSKKQRAAATSCCCVLRAAALWQNRLASGYRISPSSCCDVEH